jgi:hypothetical protein
LSCIAENVLIKGTTLKVEVPLVDVEPQVVDATTEEVLEVAFVLEVVLGVLEVDFELVAARTELLVLEVDADVFAELEVEELGPGDVRITNAPTPATATRMTTRTANITGAIAFLLCNTAHARGTRLFKALRAISTPFAFYIERWVLAFVFETAPKATSATPTTARAPPR